MLFLTPMSAGAIYGFIAFPAWVAVNGDWGWFATDVLGCLTLLFGGIAFCGVLNLVLGRDLSYLEGNGEQAMVPSASQRGIDTFRDVP